jgi:hypothetical protein
MRHGTETNPQERRSLLKSPVALEMLALLFAGPMYIYIEIIN